MPLAHGFPSHRGARTALFNWLYAKRFGGKMLLRIEDTDRERSTDAAISAIIDGLSWLGLQWDGDPIYQFARADRHARRRCNCWLRAAPTSALQRSRNSRRCASRPAPKSASRVYDGRWRDRSAADIAAAEAQGLKPVIRLKSVQEGDTVIDDKVQGRVVFPNKDLDDLILLRSDGNPTTCSQSSSTITTWA